MGIPLILLAIVMATVMYFLPTIVAAKREHHNLVAILALNFLLGWTLLGWAVALVWALTRRPTGSPA